MGNEQDAIDRLATTLRIRHFRNTRIPQTTGQLDFDTANEALGKILLDHDDDSWSSADPSQDPGQMEAAENKFETAVINSCRHQALVVTDEAKLALTFEMAQPGDEILVLLGCQRAMLLRKKDPNTHQIVGAVYSLGVNDREALVDKLPFRHIRRVMMYKEHTMRRSGTHRAFRGLYATTLMRASIAHQEIPLV